MAAIKPTEFTVDVPPGVAPFRCTDFRSGQYPSDSRRPWAGPKPSHELGMRVARYWSNFYHFARSDETYIVRRHASVFEAALQALRERVLHYGSPRLRDQVEQIRTDIETARLWLSTDAKKVIPKGDHPEIVAFRERHGRMYRLAHGIADRLQEFEKEAWLEIECDPSLTPIQRLDRFIRGSGGACHRLMAAERQDWRPLVCQDLARELHAHRDAFAEEYVPLTDYQAIHDIYGEFDDAFRGWLQPSGVDSFGPVLAALQKLRRFERTPPGDRGRVGDARLSADTSERIGGEETVGTASLGKLEKPWLTITDCASLLLLDVDNLTLQKARARVSAAATAGHFTTNGKQRMARRVEPVSFDAWRLQQRERDLDSKR